MSLQPSRAIRFSNFGYLPAGTWRSDLAGWLYGCPNLIKRLQAPDLIRALDIHPTHHVLDFGCGSGYVAVELAKLSTKTIGIDVNPYVATIKIPARMKGHLEFVQIDGTTLPFPDQSFDRVLASEVMPMFSSPEIVLREMRRVLKPNGKLVVLNGLGHPAIEEGYAQQSPRLRRLQRRYPDRFPRDYADYCRTLQTLFGTAQNRFLTEAEILQCITATGFKLLSVSHTPRKSAGTWLSWHQFEYYLKTGGAIVTGRFLRKFVWLTLMSVFDHEDYSGGLLIVASPDSPA